MNTKSKLEFTKAQELQRQVDEAVARYGGTFKEWYIAASKIPNFPSKKTLYSWMQSDRWGEARLLNALRRALPLSRIEFAAGNFGTDDQPLLADDEFYLTINRVIDAVGKSAANPKIIRLCVMSGTNEPREVKEPNPRPGWIEFSERMTKSILDPKWRVEILYNVPNQLRFRQILQRLREAKHAENHEVRAYGPDARIPTLNPLIIGRYDAFLALSHTRFYRAQSGMHFRGADSIAFVDRYWHKLWDHARVIRSDAEMKLKELKKLERELETRT